MLVLALLALWPAQSQSADTNTLTTIFEQIAKTNRHFSREVIIESKALKIPRFYAGERDKAQFRTRALDQYLLLRQLQDYIKHRDELLKLLKHENPKVRTLALGALFQREEARDLPFIASLLHDYAATFPHLSDHTDSSGTVPSAEGQEVYQSVETVASAMLIFWGAPRSG
ncbi:MAG: hypothetical protein K0Q55_2132 [Verrucomicrobia bacterium]|nr:hypothetical protein [Verrucomicrobiota bacterium]